MKAEPMLLTIRLGMIRNKVREIFSGEKTCAVMYAKFRKHTEAENFSENLSDNQTFTKTAH
jgi:hypothetical protein